MNRLAMMIVAAMAWPASAAVITIDYSGTFTNSFGSSLVPLGTAFKGSLTYDSDSIATVTNMFDKRYAFAGPFTLTIGSVSYAGSINAFAAQGPFGPPSVGFSQALPDNQFFTLNFNSLPSGSVIDRALPNTPTVFGTSALAGISNARMQGNFGTAVVSATLAAPATVPEPAVWALNVMGFGLVGLLARRRRKTLASG